MFVNIVIPVCSLHMKWIEPCLNNLEQQTRKPDKIILVINEYVRYKNAYDKIINKYPQYVFIKIDTFERPGVNRNTGSQYVEDGIIIYHDIDDLMHKQKCEIIEYLFEKYKCSLILHHNYKDYQEIPESYDKNTLKIILQNDVVDVLIGKTNLFNDDSCIVHFNYHFGDTNNKNNHSELNHGHCNVLTSVLKDNPTFWTDLYEAEDVTFCSKVTRVYKNTLILLEPLTIVVGTEHIRKIDDKIYCKKSKKLLDYDPIVKPQ